MWSTKISVCVCVHMLNLRCSGPTTTTTNHSFGVSVSDFYRRTQFFAWFGFDFFVLFCLSLSLSLTLSVSISVCLCLSLLPLTVFYFISLTEKIPLPFFKQKKDLRTIKESQFIIGPIETHTPEARKTYY